MSETEAKDSAWVLPSVDVLPAASAQKCTSPAPGPTEASSISPLSRTVLIVEDDRAARVAIARILRRRFFVVSEAANVADALAELAGEPEWILLDLMLPDGSGIDVLRK